MLGLSLHSWEDLMIFALAIVGAFGVVVGVATFAVVRLQRAEIADSKREFDQYKLEVAEKTAFLNNETERLQADNLALQTVLQQRRAGLFGVNEEPPAKRWFAGVERWAGTKVLIQVIPGDREAMNLAHEIAAVLSRFGWNTEEIDERRSGESLNLEEGLRVFSPSSYKAFDPENPAQQGFSKLNEARVALANALTKAGLGVGEYPVQSALMVVDFPPDSDAAKSGSGSKFNPQLDALYLQVGSRPVASTVEWIKRGRPDMLGNKPVPATEAQPHK